MLIGRTFLSRIEDVVAPAIRDDVLPFGFRMFR